MKRLIAAAALLALPFSAGAQSFVVAGRASAGAEFKIAKGLELSFEEEVRSADSFSALGSLRHDLSFSYKPVKFLKVGLGYTMINPWKVEKELSNGVPFTGFWDPKHRLHADISGVVRLGDWQLSLKERFQMTYNADPDMNINQNPRTAIALKSKATVKYRGIKHFEPYLSGEVRTFLNGAWGSTSGAAQTTEKTKKVFFDYTPEGYTHIYNNRYRAELGAEIRLAKHHYLTPYLLMDFCSDYEIDTNKEGTRLFVATTGWEDVLRLSPGISYVYKF